MCAESVALLETGEIMKKLSFTMLSANCLVLGCALLTQSQTVLAARNAHSQHLSQAFVANASCGNPRGIKLKVRAFFTITNSDDGFRDHEVETYGEVLFGSWQIWKIARKRSQ